MFAIIALMLAAASADERVNLDEVATVRLGESEGVARSKLTEWGELKRTDDGNGQVTLVAGETTAILCTGKVVSVSREYLDGFDHFAALAELITKQYGPAKPADILRIAGERPATDPRGEMKISISGIRITWPAAPKYLLGYSEINGTKRAFESLNDKNPCKRKPV